MSDDLFSRAAPEYETSQRRNGKPYVWPTWITGLISGEKHCQWAAWFKAHYRYIKRVDENEGGLTIWTVNHAALVRRTVERLQSDTKTVMLEDQNSFSYRGKTAVVGGKPDILAIDNEEPIAEIVDCKSGRDRASDFVQVAIYLLLAPHSIDALKQRELSGRVVYVDRGERLVTMTDVKALEDAIVTHVKIAGADAPPARTPSESECKFCDIACCPDRKESLPELEPEDGNLF